MGIVATVRCDNEGGTANDRHSAARSAINIEDNIAGGIIIAAGSGRRFVGSLDRFVHLIWKTAAPLSRQIFEHLRARAWRLQVEVSYNIAEVLSLKLLNRVGVVTIGTPYLMGRSMFKQQTTPHSHTTDHHHHTFKIYA